MKAKFDWNKTPIAPLGTKRNMFTPHYDKTFVTGMSPHHYLFLEFFVPATHGYRILLFGVN